MVQFAHTQSLPQKMKLPFGLRTSDNRLVSISEVERGANCGCVCPHCHAELLARKSPTAAHHFTHLASEPCAGGLAVTVLLMAQQLIQEKSTIWLPRMELNLLVSGKNPETSTPGTWSEAVTEPVHAAGAVKLLHCIHSSPENDEPGISATWNGKPLAIELLVRARKSLLSNFIQESGGIAVVEFDLQPLLALPPDKLEIGLHAVLFGDSVFSKWLQHPGTAAACLRLKASAEQKKKERMAGPRSPSWMPKVPQDTAPLLGRSISMVSTQVGDSNSTYYRVTPEVVVHIGANLSDCWLRIQGGGWGGLSLETRILMEEVLKRDLGSAGPNAWKCMRRRAPPHLLMEDLKTTFEQLLTGAGAVLVLKQIPAEAT